MRQPSIGSSRETRCIFLLPINRLPLMDTRFDEGTELQSNGCLFASEAAWCFSKRYGATSRRIV